MALSTRAVTNLTLELNFRKSNCHFSISLWLTIAGAAIEGIKKASQNCEALVPGAGIEPALPKELDFESSASTNSATRASCGIGRQK